MNVNNNSPAEHSPSAWSHWTRDWRRLGLVNVQRGCNRCLIGLYLALMTLQAQAFPLIVVDRNSLADDTLPAVVGLPDGRQLDLAALRFDLLGIASGTLIIDLSPGPIVRYLDLSVAEVLQRRGYSLARMSVLDPGTGLFHQPRDVELISGSLDALNGLVHVSEQAFLTRPLPLSALDSDRDGLSDAVETGTGEFVSDTDTGTDPLVADSDGDFIDDGEEITLGTNPLRRDSDGDGINDNIELADGTDPTIPNPALIARYTFDDDVGPALADQAGTVDTKLIENGNGHVYRSDSIPAGAFGNLTLTREAIATTGGIDVGPGEWISETDTELGDLVNDFTVMTWIKPASVSGRQHIFSRLLSGSFGWGWGLDNDELMMTGFDIVDVFSIDAGVSAGEWQHLAVTKSSIDGVRFYVNGALVSSAPSVTGDFGVSTDRWGLLGRANHENFTGRVDEVRTYRGPMQPAQIIAAAQEAIPAATGAEILAPLFQLLLNNTRR